MLNLIIDTSNALRQHSELRQEVVKALAGMTTSTSEQRWLNCARHTVRLSPHGKVPGIKLLRVALETDLKTARDLWEIGKILEEV